MLMWGDVFTFFPAPTFLSPRRAVRNSPTLERTAIHSICGFENAKYKTWQKQQKKSNGNVGWCCVKNKITETISKIEYHNRINAMKLEWAVASSLRENALKSQHRATLHLTGLNLRFPVLMPLGCVGFQVTLPQFWNISRVTNVLGIDSIGFPVKVQVWETHNNCHWHPGQHRRTEDNNQQREPVEPVDLPMGLLPWTKFVHESDNSLITW